MAEHQVTFTTLEDSPGAQPAPPTTVSVPTGTLLTEAAKLAGVEVNQPCGAQGRCGRCTLQITKGDIRRRSTVRLSPSDIAEGYALACQSIIEGDVSVIVPPQEKIERLLTTERTVAEVVVPATYEPQQDQTIQKVTLHLTPPDMSDQTDDWSRLKTALRKQAGIQDALPPLRLLRNIGPQLREADWHVTAVLDTASWDCPDCPPRIIDILPASVAETKPLLGAAIDIGTTTVTLWLVNLE
ncbi:MAG: 2Fe-2S iron-sulfur cluster-binding protein, partial [Anaerolineales bacterium]